MHEKKIVVVIVEGPSDETALGGVLNEYFSSTEVKFKVIHGDITSDYTTTADNVVSRINEVIQSLEEYFDFRPGDIQSVLHIADTDGAFTENSVTQGSLDHILYFTDHMEAEDIAEAETRNRRKAEILFKLWGQNYLQKIINGKKYKIPYKIYYNSCNLEHVLYGSLMDYTDDEKLSMADDFADRYEGKLDEFLNFIRGTDVAVSGTYQQTWKYIEKDKHSLERHTNMHLIFA